jgi:hypothetical protein
MIVYKYPLYGPNVLIEVPKDSVILSAKYLNDQICVWILNKDENINNETLRVISVNTGNDSLYGFKKDQLKFIDTVISDNGIVWHIFEVLK